MLYQSTILSEPNLKLYYKFDDTSFPLINSGPVTGLDIPSGAENPLINQVGKVGRSITHQSGTADQLTGNISANGDFGDVAISCEFTLKLPSTGTPSGYLFDYSRSDKTSVYVRAGFNSRNLGIYSYNGYQWWYNTDVDYDDTWHHYVYTYSKVDGKCRGYIDGVLKFTSAGAEVSLYNAGNYNFKTNFLGGTYSIDWCLDEFSLYADEALDQTKVTAHYNAWLGTGGTPSAPDVDDEFQHTVTGDVIARGGNLDATSVRLGCSNIVSSEATPVRLQVECKSLVQAFDGVTNLYTATSYVASGSSQYVTVTGLTRDTAYHWRARVQLEFNGSYSAWTPYSSGTDFVVIPSAIPDSSPTINIIRQIPNLKCLIPFTESSGNIAYNLVSGGDSAILYSGVTHEADGATISGPQWSINLNGTTSWVDCGTQSAPAVDGTKSFSYGLAFKKDTYDVTSQISTLVSRGTLQANMIATLTTSDSCPSVYLTAGKGQDYGAASSELPRVLVSNDYWKRIGFSWNAESSIASLYVDGELYCLSDTVFSTWSASAPLTLVQSSWKLGVWDTNSDHESFFKGNLAEFWVASTVVSQDTFRAITRAANYEVGSISSISLSYENIPIEVSLSATNTFIRTDDSVIATTYTYSAPWSCVVSGDTMTITPPYTASDPGPYMFKVVAHSGRYDYTSNWPFDPTRISIPWVDSAIFSIQSCVNIAPSISTLPVVDVNQYESTINAINIASYTSDTNGHSRRYFKSSVTLNGLVVSAPWVIVNDTGSVDIAAPDDNVYYVQVGARDDASPHPSAHPITAYASFKLVSLGASSAAIIVDSSPIDTTIAIKETFIFPVEIGAMPSALFLTRRPVINVVEMRTESASLTLGSDYILQRDVNSEYAASAYSIDRVFLTDAAKAKLTSGGAITALYTYDACVGNTQRTVTGGREDALNTVGAALTSVRIKKARPIETLVKIKVASILPSASNTILNNNNMRDMLATYLSSNIFIAKLNTTITALDIINAVKKIDPTVIIATSGIIFSKKVINTDIYVDQAAGSSVVYGPSTFPLLTAVDVSR